MADEGASEGLEDEEEEDDEEEEKGVAGAAPTVLRGMKGLLAGICSIDVVVDAVLPAAEEDAPLGE